MGTDLVDGRTTRLTDWQKAYASWLVSLDREVTISEKRQQMSLLAGRPLPKADAIALEKRAVFRAYVQELSRDAVGRALEDLKAMAPKVIEQFGQMRERAYEAGDYKEFMKYATPIIERVWPKHGSDKRDSPTVVIQMGQGFAQKVTATVENEVFVVEPDGN